MNIKQTASKEQIKKAKKRAGKGKHSLKTNNPAQLAKIAFIYER